MFCRDGGLATAQTKSAPLTPFPCLAGGLLTKYKRSKVLINQLSLFSTSSSLKQSLWRGDEKWPKGIGYCADKVCSVDAFPLPHRRAPYKI